MDPVVDFSDRDLSKISTEKLIKMRDIAGDRCVELSHEYDEQKQRLRDIFVELESRESFKNPE